MIKQIYTPGRCLFASNPVPHHLQQLLRVLYRVLTVRDAEFLVEVADMRLNGGRGHRQFAGNLFVAVTGIDKP